jgi:hypothetical protein
MHVEKDELCWIYQPIGSSWQCAGPQQLATVQGTSTVTVPSASAIVEPASSIFTVHPKPHQNTNRTGVKMATKGTIGRLDRYE